METMKLALETSEHYLQLLGQQPETAIGTLMEIWMEMVKWDPATLASSLPILDWQVSKA